MRGKENNERENWPLVTDELVEVLRLHENYPSFEGESIEYIPDSKRKSK
jgi:hypothetical protein